MEVSCAKTSHETCWILYPGPNQSIYKIVDTPDQRIDGRAYKPESWKIVCKHCGVVWAERLNVHLPNKNWAVKMWPCVACNGGSLWDAWNEPWNRSLPFQLLIREMNIIKDWYDEGIRTYRQFFQYKHFKRKV